MRQGVTALLGGLLLLALAGCAVPGGVHLDGWTVRQVRVTVVAGPSWPIRDATVAWFRGAGEDSPRLTTTTDASVVASTEVSSPAGHSAATGGPEADCTFIAGG